MCQNEEQLHRKQPAWLLCEPHEELLVWLESLYHCPKRLVRQRPSLIHNWCQLAAAVAENCLHEPQG